MPDTLERPICRTFTESRVRLASVLDAAAQGLAPQLTRGDQAFVVTDLDRLRTAFAARIDPETQVFTETPAGETVVEWAGFLPAVPSVSGSGNTFDELLDDLVLAARSYARDWAQYLRHAPNHQANWEFVQLVELSSDAQLRDWLTK